MTKLPILVLAFNRADHVKKALEPIRRYKPDRIYFACDGPRTHIEGETKAVEDTRQTMLASVDWPCEVKTLFRDVNLGCARGVSSAIDWFFEDVEYGIIIEDDVIVGEDFFKLCEELLPRYKDNDRIMEISAMNYGNRTDDNISYVYSQCYHCWGWATWRRAWNKMDMSMSCINHITIPYIVKRLGLFRGIIMYRYFKIGYRNINTFNSWATRWFLSILYYDGLVICPIQNLVKNIGVTEGAHYSKQDSNRIENKLKIGNLTWPLKYDDSCIIDLRQKKIDSLFFLQQRIEGLRKKV